MNEQRTHQGKPIIAFDGKVLRGSFRGNAKDALQLVTAYDTENGLVLSQKATPNKKGEIETVKEMLDILELKGAVVTLDALHCQRETLEKISEKKAHVVVQVKKNHKPFNHNSKDSLMRRKRRLSSSTKNVGMAAKKNAMCFN